MWSIPYGETKEPFFWGPRTAAVNFCEEDYIITHYVAEFFNTLTSLAYIAYGVHGIRRYKRQNLSIFAEANLSYWALIGVGLFSGLYHLTLKYHTQMSDELSMHLAIGTVLQQVYTFKEPPKVQVRNTAIILGVLVPFVIYHCLADEFILHVILFFCMSWIVAGRVRKLIREQIKDPAHRAKLRSMVTGATVTALFAYFLWNIDVHCCGTLTRWKRQLGMPLGILLELHGYWHILTSISAYMFMAIIEFLISDEDANRRRGFAWPAHNFLKDLLPAKPTGTEKMNGTAKRMD